VYFTVLIAGLLEEQATIPMVKEQLALLEELQSQEWCEDVTLAMLEQVHMRLRLLVRFIEKRRRRVLHSDFEDEMGPETEFDLLGVMPPESMERFRGQGTGLPPPAPRQHLLSPEQLPKRSKVTEAGQVPAAPPVRQHRRPRHEQATEKP